MMRSSVPRRTDETEQVHRRADPSDRQGRRGRPKGRRPVSCDGINEQTYYRWKAKYGGLELSEIQRFKQLEDENRRLKHIVAELALPTKRTERWSMDFMVDTL